jgi:hypothetical protein
VHVTGFESLAAYQAYREAAGADGALAKAPAELAGLAPERRTELLEALGPIPETTLDASIEASAAAPATRRRTSRWMPSSARCARSRRANA